MKNYLLQLELKKKNILLEHYKKRLAKYTSANQKIANVISVEEIEDLEVQISTLELEIEIIKLQISDANHDNH